ncbi:MAG TPA: ribosomal protein S18-alanine N-acetyltransferase [Bacillota bacterium]|nr:ribosomal protein S18-alanine N-acetyltransferase [Bacillota bacterium]
MCLADLEGVLEIETLSFTTPWSRQSFLHEILENERAVYLVYKENDKVAGYIGMWVVLDEGHITNLAIHPAYRQRGFGRSLIEHLEDEGRKRGVRHLTLEVRKTNMPAQNLYRNMGFTSVGVRRQYYLDNKEDAIIMWKGPI